MTAPRSPWAPDKPDVANVVPGPPPVEPDAPLAVEEMLIQREDLGSGAATLIKAGDRIPDALAERPRRAVGTVEPEPKSPRGRPQKATD
nr:hypothetical protein [Pseudonocardia acaciae]